MSKDEGYHHFTATELHASAVRGQRMACDMLEFAAHSLDVLGLRPLHIHKLDLVHAVGSMAVRVFKSIEPEPQTGNPLDPRLIEFDNWCATVREALVRTIEPEKKP